MMAARTDRVLRWLVISEEEHLLSQVILLLLLRSTTHSRVNEALGIVLGALGVDVGIAEVLPAEGAYELVLLELTRVPVDQARPLIHLMTSLLVELVLVVVVLLFELLRELPDDIVLELKQLALLLVVLQEGPSLRQLSRQVIRQHIDLHLKLLGDSIFDVLIDLSVLVQETY